jgi:hypothetical protein
MPSISVQQGTISVNDRATKGFLALIPGASTEDQNATITYYQDTTSNGDAYVRFGNTRDSTSSTTGAVVVDGGLGVAKTLHVGTDLRVSGSTASTDQTTGCATFAGGVGIVADANIGGSVTCSDLTVSENVIVEGQMEYTNDAYVIEGEWTGPFSSGSIAQTIYVTRMGKHVFVSARINSDSRDVNQQQSLTFSDALPAGFRPYYLVQSPVFVNAFGYILSVIKIGSDGTINIMPLSDYPIPSSVLIPPWHIHFHL